jgi:hypothetical protein
MAMFYKDRTLIKKNQQNKLLEPMSQHHRHTFLSWPALANNFPSDEKWQHTTLLVLARRQPTSLKENPVTMHPMLYIMVRIRN